MKHVFIDGSAGTTGLRIRERLAERTDIGLITLPEASRKDENARREALSSADVAFLCLPDDAAREAVGMVQNPDTVVIDTSTAHRTAPDFASAFRSFRRNLKKKSKHPSASPFRAVMPAALLRLCIPSSKAACCRTRRVSPATPSQDTAAAAKK